MFTFGRLKYIWKIIYVRKTKSEITKVADCGNDEFKKNVSAVYNVYVYLIK